jgi:hypothetical protein
MTITDAIRDELAADETSPRLRRMAWVTALVGGPLFLVAVVLHPARDGIGVHAAGAMYGITHALQAMSLILQAVCLVSVYAAGVQRFGRRGIPAFLSALVGTLLWFGLIAIDGSRNPVVARYAPALVHSAADLEPGVAMIILPALVLFPIGYVLLARLLAGVGAKWPGLLLGVGAVLYVLGGLCIFALGPHSPLIRILEISGAVPYALGFVLLGREGVARPASSPRLIGRVVA